MQQGSPKEENLFANVHGVTLDGAVIIVLLSGV